MCTDRKRSSVRSKQHHPSRCQTRVAPCQIQVGSTVADVTCMIVLFTRHVSRFSIDFWWARVSSYAPRSFLPGHRLIIVTGRTLKLSTREASEMLFFFWPGVKLLFDDMYFFCLIIYSDFSLILLQLDKIVYYNAKEDVSTTCSHYSDFLSL